MILGGLDEAGYGPILGPLVVGCATFDVADAETAVAASSALRRALEGDHGVTLGDSKKIHVPSRGPGKLEHLVLSVLAARDGEPPADVAALLRTLGVPALPTDHRWYASLLARSLPLAAKPDAVAASASAFRSALDAEGVVLGDVGTRVLVEGRFNEAVERKGSKAEVLFDEATVLLERMLTEAAGRPADIVCDRQGARSRYGAMLQDRFPKRYVRILGEGGKAAVYDLGEGGVPATVRFLEKADGRSAVTGLASMAAKYVREVFMETLNRVILAEAEGVKKTAGYWTDGLRFLTETTEARSRLGIKDRLFIRTR